MINKNEKNKIQEEDVNVYAINPFVVHCAL
jgi:hypothetical protein